MLKAGVLGAGHLGKIHLRLLNQSENYQLVGFYDADETNAKNIEAEFGYKYFNTIDLGLNIGAYYYWHQGLFLGARCKYGLMDVTKDNYDVSQGAWDSSQNFVQRSDKDRNVAVQFSIGFSF